MTSWLDDPHKVAAEYESEEAFRERTLAFTELLEGPDEEEIVRARLLATRPGRLLEVGSGLGDLSVWAKAKLGGKVVAMDSSARMVELASRANGSCVTCRRYRSPGTPPHGSPSSPSRSASR